MSRVPSDAGGCRDDPCPPGFMHTIDRHVAVCKPPADCFYWAVLSVPKTRRRQRPSARHYAFEPWIPTDIASVEMRFGVVSSTAHDHQLVLACGIERDRLAELIDRCLSALEPGASLLSLTPSEPPSFLASMSEVDPDLLASAAEGFEFRSGEFECPRLRRRRLRIARVTAAAYVVSCCVLTVMWALGAARLRDESAHWRQSADTLAMECAEAARTNRPGAGVDPRLLVLSELRTLRQTREGGHAGHASEDRLDTLIELLARWPEGTPTLVRSMSLDQDAIGIRGEVRDAGEYEQLASALDSNVHGWSRPVGNASRAQLGYSFNLTMRRDRAASVGVGGQSPGGVR